ncbi:methionine--tRNA ligase [Nitratifractor salsuginis]|uniref:Methionine--tRNA ligase n=1 Tax=Nitratifractor salsuginis (strain DSM 16511 / JCM 12458 / E9I37-1) TaxID=749222 RepID=E6WZ78_NITSE|nr:methionine--tRNA ligase [Nitratifractor salsuginis]ADV46590.1 methionyl-tRNA synthetase [Nitratifractor salsuginis DSM 16511]
MSEHCKKAYITTPIYYVNDIPHIGHAYTTIIADTLAIYSRMAGLETFFLTGTDEHGQKIEEAAKKRGKSPKEYADEISGRFKALWDEFDISYDKFIRTTDEDHKLGVQAAFKKMYEKGDIYKDVYRGHYCISCEAFFTETQLVDGEFCPECGKPTQIVEEESYFFRLSKYQDKLLEWYRENEKCILPKTRRNEVMRFVEGGLDDLSITRTSFDWGVKLPPEINDPKHVMYVWLDALMNYLTALGYGTDEKLLDFWPARVHLIGKDILRFHAVYWPAFLMSLDMPLPKHIAAHGWWTRNGEKMSKSKGNVINPKEVADAYGLENFRYFMLREVPFGGDGDFSQKALIDRINSDLGNDLGNLLNRLIGMSGKYSEGSVSSAKVAELYGDELAEVHDSLDKLEPLLFEMQLHRYLEELWKPLSIANKSIDKYQPWVLMKEGKTEEALALLGLIANILAKVSVMLHPVMPKTTDTIARALGFTINQTAYEDLIKRKDLLSDFTIEKVPPLFPRIEEQLLKEATPAEEKAAPKKEASKKEKAKSEEPQGLITIDQFFQTSLKVGTVLEAEEVPKSKKLLLLQVDLGEEQPRQIVAGIKEWYAPADLVGTQVCVVANLKPAKLMGLRSEGMLLAAKDEEGLALIRPEKPKKPGTPIG